MPKPTKKKRTVKAWWLRKGGEGFYAGDLWRNSSNARFAAKGKHFADTQSHTGKSKYKVIPITIIYYV